MADDRILRGRALERLGSVLVSGVTPADRPWLEALDELRPVLARDLDALAAEHHRICEREVFLYESVFLTSEAQLGGDRSGALRQAYEQVGFTAHSAEPDHLGMELIALGALAAHEHAGPATEAWQAALIDHHLARWLPIAAQAVKRQDSDLFGPVVQLALELVGVHRDTLPEVAPAPFDEAMPPAALLDDPKTGLARIARHLLIPASSGLFLSRDDLTRIATRTELPGGFGPRVKMLESMFFTAVDHGELPRLTAALGAVVEDFEGALAAASQFATYRPAVETWRDRHAWTREVLRRLAEGA